MDNKSIATVLYETADLLEIDGQDSFRIRSYRRAGVREYWALDKDPRAIAAAREYARVRADKRLRPVQWNIADGWQAVFAAGLPARCDLGLLLKVVPVVGRQSPELLRVLGFDGGTRRRVTLRSGIARWAKARIVSECP